MLEAEDLILISVDDHLIEPPDLFVHHLDAKYLDRAPKLVRNDEGNDVWTFGKVVMETAALNAVAGRPKEEYGLEPQSLDEVRPGCYDVHERVKDMDAGGVLASMNFPSFPTFTARVFATDDADLSLALVRAYNDWHIDEWCGAHPGRFIPMAVPAIWDAEQTAAEVRRVAAKGCHSLSFTENPAALGYPSFHDDYWDPVWTGVLRHRHRAVDPPRLVGSPVDPRRRLAAGRDDHAAADEHPVGRGRPAVVPRAEELPRPAGGALRGRDRLDPLLPRPGRPHLRDAPRLDAPGLRWPPPQRGVPRALPDLLHQRPRRRRACGTASASTTWRGRPTTPTATRCGPTAPEELSAVFAANDVPDDEIAKMTHENAMRWYSFDPFTHVPKAEATVGALRRRAAGHDVSIMSRSTRVRTPDEKLEGFRQRARRRRRRPGLMPAGGHSP